MTAKPKALMTVDEFLVWSMAQPSGRYELVNGEVWAQSSERARHNLGKAAIYKALDAAVKKANLPCTVFTDGMTVKIDQKTAREPDAAVQCGVAFDPDGIVLEAPLIVVEVISPATERDDTSTKLTEYFSVPSIMHYLIVDARRPALIHHRRAEAGEIATRVLTSGPLRLDPPGIDVDVESALDFE